MTAFHTYNPEPTFGADYTKLRDFLIKLDSHNYHYGRWDWMITHGYLDAAGLPRIGLWEEDGAVVAAATYDCSLGGAYLLMDAEHRYLGEALLAYAQTALAKDGAFKALILDGDTALQDTAARRGLRPTTDKENDAVLPLTAPYTTCAPSLGYALPDGFRVVSMNDEYDLYKYGQVLWKGFNHEQRGEGPFNPTDKDLANGERSFRRPGINLDLKIAVAAPNGDFVSYCGMWYDPASPSALVEPVATDPTYRKMGLGRAAVLEAVKCCAALGAKRAFVGSDQQFYYSIGFRPYATSTWWAAPAK